MRESSLIAEDAILSRSDLVMVQQAITKGWDIPDNLLQKLPDKLVEIINTEDSKEYSPRVKLRAIEVLVKMRQQNLDQLPKKKTGMKVSGKLDQARLRQELAHDPKFLEYCRSIQENSNTGVPSSDSQPGTVDVGEASTDSGQGDNGPSIGEDGPSPIDGGDAATTRKELVGQ